MKSVDLYIGPIRRLVTPLGKHAQRGRDMGRVLDIPDAAIAVEDGRIVALGRHKSLRRQFRGKRTIEAGSWLATPGFVDSHTHALFASPRSREYGMKIRGATYQQIAKAGGGILNSCDELRATTSAKLKNNLRRVLSRMRSQGTTCAEVKSGYGLDLESEIRMLKVIREVGLEDIVRIVPTFLGAHEVPREYKGRKAQFVRDLVIDWIPEVARRGLAEFCDVFCDQGVFNSKDSAIILYVAREHGLKPKIHSDEFKAIGGTELAAQIGAISADHLAAVTAKGIKALKNSSTVATLLPATCLTLDFEKWPPARELISSGIPVALATDCNPGSSMTESLPLVMSLACNKMRMTPQETLCAVTLNGAAALDRAHLSGSLQIDKFADISFWNASCIEEIPYHMNGNLCAGTIIGGDESIQTSTNLSPYR